MYLESLFYTESDLLDELDESVLLEEPDLLEELEESDLLDGLLSGLWDGFPCLSCSEEELLSDEFESEDFFSDELAPEEELLSDELESEEL